MIAIDTNVLVCIIVEDTGQPEQTKIARQLVKNAQKVYITQIVQIEFTWVLARVYKIDKIRLSGLSKWSEHTTCLQSSTYVRLRYANRTYGINTF